MNYHETVKDILGVDYSEAFSKFFKDLLEARNQIEKESGKKPIIILQSRRGYFMFLLGKALKNEACLALANKQADGLIYVYNSRILIGCTKTKEQLKNISHDCILVDDGIVNGNALYKTYKRIMDEYGINTRQIRVLAISDRFSRYDNFDQKIFSTLELSPERHKDLTIRIMKLLLKFGFSYVIQLPLYKVSPVNIPEWKERLRKNEHWHLYDMPLQVDDQDVYENHFYLKPKTQFFTEPVYSEVIRVSYRSDDAGDQIGRLYFTPMIFIRRMDMEKACHYLNELFSNHGDINDEYSEAFCHGVGDEFSMESLYKMTTYTLAQVLMHRFMKENGGKDLYTKVKCDQYHFSGSFINAVNSIEDNAVVDLYNKFFADDTHAEHSRTVPDIQSALSLWPQDEISEAVEKIRNDKALLDDGARIDRLISSMCAAVKDKTAGVYEYGMKVPVITVNHLRSLCVLLCETSVDGAIDALLSKALLKYTSQSACAFTVENDGKMIYQAIRVGELSYSKHLTDGSKYYIYGLNRYLGSIFNVKLLKKSLPNFMKSLTDYLCWLDSKNKTHRPYSSTAGIFNALYKNNRSFIPYDLSIFDYVLSQKIDADDEDCKKIRWFVAGYAKGLNEAYRSRGSHDLPDETIKALYRDSDLN